MISGVLFALIAERVIRHVWRRIREEDSRIHLAGDALEQQQHDLDQILHDKSVDLDIKKFALDVSGSILDRDTALRYAYLIECDWETADNVSPEDNKQIQIFEEKIATLAIRNKPAFERFMAIAWRSVIASVLQWSDTSKRSIPKISLKMASESPMRAAHSMAILRSEAQHHPVLSASRARHAYV
jgi:hypothetical protein